MELSFHQQGGILSTRMALFLHPRFRPLTRQNRPPDSFQVGILNLHNLGLLGLKLIINLSNKLFGNIFDFAFPDFLIILR